MLQFSKAGCGNAELLKNELDPFRSAARQSADAPVQRCQNAVVSVSQTNEVCIRHLPVGCDQRIPATRLA